MAAEKNIPIKEYLDYYLALDTSPEFAVLLRGKWGSGKSWFIKDYLGQYMPDTYLYVSLHGVTSYSEIEDAFFQQLHPVLSVRGMKLAGRILKGLAKTTIKIDMESDGREEGGLLPSVPDFSVPYFLKKSDSRYIVLDDLERCSIPIQNVLGYINQFVEMGGQKVILIANEDEIIKVNEQNEPDEDTKRYLTIKEKLIGKSFDVETDLPAAMDEFIELVTSPQCKKWMIANCSLLTELFNTGGYNNLRHLKQAIMDFDRFYVCLPESVMGENELMSHIMQLFFAISFELKKGGIKEDEIWLLFDVASRSTEAKAGKANAEQIRKKYSVFENYYYPVTAELWTQFFRTGVVDKNQLKAAIESSVLLQKEESPYWVQLWHHQDLDDDEFTALYQSVYNDFRQLGTFKKYEVLQVTGLLLKLSDLKLIPLKTSKILHIGRDNIDALKLLGNLTLQRSEVFPDDNSHGLKYQSLDNPHFQEFLFYAVKSVNEALESDLVPQANDLLELLPQSLEAFGEKITLTNSAESLYFDRPILSHIKPRNFIAAVLNLSNKDKRSLAYFIEKRYQLPDAKTKLKGDLVWLKEVRQLLIHERDRLNGKLSGLIIASTLLVAVTKSIDTLQTVTLFTNV